jgi:hypothetical protein
MGSKGVSVLRTLNTTSSLYLISNFSMGSKGNDEFPFFDECANGF